MINDSQIQELIEHILSGNVVLFLGAASFFSSRDTSGNLTAELIRHCNYNEPDHSFAKVAEYYELFLGRHSLEQRICNWIERQQQQPSLFDQAIARLPFSRVVTTRTDLMLEQAYRQAGRPILSIVR